MPDPVSLALTFLLQAARPVATDAMRNATTAPRDYRPQSQTLPDVGAAVLQCYHSTGRFRAAQVLQAPWQEARQWQATQSAVLRISYTGGFTGQPYAMDVALMEREGRVRAVVLSDNALTPPSRRCALEAWQAPGPAR